MTRLLSARGIHKTFEMPGGVSVPSISGVDLDVDEGEVVAIVGPNGAGKSTLLRVLSGITAPSSGVVERVQATASLIDASAWMEPDLTAAESLDVGMAIAGRRASAELRQQIMEFAGLHRVEGVAIKRFSDGMRARLAVSLALHSDAKLLLFDEILAVGDLAFQEAAVARVEAQRAEGVGVVLVTHEPSLALRLASEAIWLDAGVIVDRGDPERVVRGYVSASLLTRFASRVPHTRITSIRVSPERLVGDETVQVSVVVDRGVDAPGANVVIEVLPAVGDGDTWWMRPSANPNRLRELDILGYSTSLPFEPGAPGGEFVCELTSLPHSPPGLEVAAAALSIDGREVHDERSVFVPIAGEPNEFPVQIRMALSAYERRTSNGEGAR